jgi:hypothetical protein
VAYVSDETGQAEVWVVSFQGNATSFKRIITSRGFGR